MSAKVETLSGINERLKAAGIRLKVEQRGQWLNLLGTLPSKDGKGRKQQRLALGLDATPYGLKEAERMAMTVWVQLGRGQFSWADYLRVPLDTCGAWVLRYKEDWFKRRGSSPLLADPSTCYHWEHHHGCFLKRLPMNVALDLAVVLQVVEQTELHSATRAHCVGVMSRLLRFAGWSIEQLAPLQALRGSYGSRSVQQRVLPSDEQIMQARLLFKNESWRLVYDLMALYGLRNHECWQCQVEADPPYRVRVMSGKTNARYPVLPLHPDWAVAWEPWRAVSLPALNPNAPNAYYGTTTAARFRLEQVPFRPYSLRHAYAIRATVVYGLPDTISARMMGHSVEMHNRTYQQWISEAQILNAYSQAIQAR